MIKDLTIEGGNETTYNETRDNETRYNGTRDNEPTTIEDVLALNPGFCERMGIAQGHLAHLQNSAIIDILLEEFSFEQVPS